MILENKTKGYEDNKEEIEITYKSQSDQPDYITTGIKIREDGTKLYRLHYRCPACYKKGNHWVYADSKRTWCHQCNHELMVYPAHPSGNSQDTFGNFYRAGDFYDWNFWKSESQPI